MKIMIAADRPVIGDGVARAVRTSLDTAVTEQARGVPDCLRLLESWHPELAVVDVGLSMSDTRSLCAHLHGAGVRTVHVVTGPDEALRLLEAGADGIITEGEGLDGVVEAVQTVRDGNTRVPPALLGGVLQGLIQRRREQHNSSPRLELLSLREREVLALLGEGLDQTGIAHSLAITPQTAKTHIRHVLTKLGVRSRIAAAAVAVELGLAYDRSGQ